MVDDWTKSLISASVGFAFGMLAEPAKFWIAEALRIRHVRHGIYKNLSFLQYWIRKANEAHSSGKDDIATEILSQLDTDVFDYYYSSEKPLVWRVPQSNYIRMIYTLVRPALKASTLELGQRIDQANQAIDLLDAGVQQMRLDVSLLERYSAADTDEAGPWEAPRSFPTP